MARLKGRERTRRRGGDCAEQTWCKAGTESTTQPHLQAHGAKHLLLTSNSVMISCCYFLLSTIPATLQSIKRMKQLQHTHKQRKAPHGALAHRAFAPG